MHLDIFNDDAFSLSQLTAAIIDRPFQPGRLGQLGWFSTSGINTVSVSIERVGQTLMLVPAKPRGAPGTPVKQEKRSMLQISSTHLPLTGYVSADEVMGVRAFGSMSELDTVMRFVQREQDTCVRAQQVTLEYQRMGALKGQVLDSDGTTVLVDLASSFGLSMQTKDFELDSAGTRVRIKVTETERMIEDALGGVPYTGVHVLSSPEFMDAFSSHPAVEDAFALAQDGRFKREQQRGFGAFNWTWEEYRGSVGGQRFIPAGKAYAVPTGVADMFKTHFSPANYMETVNTIGLPLYMKKANDKYDKGVEFEVQSNPLHINTRLNAIVELSIT